VALFVDEGKRKQMFSGRDWVQSPVRNFGSVFQEVERTPMAICRLWSGDYFLVRCANS